MTRVPYHHAPHLGAAAIPRYRGHAAGYGFAALVDGTTGAQHLSLGVSRLAGRGTVDPHLHAHEECFYVLRGRGTLTLDGRDVALAVGDVGVIPVGAAHAWRADDDGLEWLETTAPPPVVDDDRIDTIFPAAPTAGRDAPTLETTSLEARHLSRWAGFGLDRPYGDGWPPPGTESRMIRAAPGIHMQELAGTTLGADLQRLLVVEFEPGSGMSGTSHDHPFEEAFLVLEGTVEATISGERMRLTAGDALWIGVGVPHGWANIGGERARWLEVQAPQPPRRHGIRRGHQWRRLAADLAPEPTTGPGDDG